MKNKLLLTSALVGPLMFTSSLNAQTTISGNLDLSFKAISSDGARSTSSSERAFGKETQINLANKGKLNNGLDYTAGFSLEFDGNDGNQGGTTAQNIHNENVYIDIISGNTTFTFGVDHIQNSDRTLGVLLGEDAEDLADGIAGTTAGISPSSVGSDPASTYGVGVIQKTPFGSLSGWYTPKSGGGNAGVTNNDSSSSFGTAALTDNAKAAFEIGFVGDFGVKELKTHAFYNKREKTSATAQDVKGTNFGVSYNLGQVTAGVNRKKIDETTAGTETKLMEYSVAFAATKELTIGLNYSNANQTGKAVDEKVKSLALGYNFGPVVLLAQYGDIDNQGGATANTADGKVGYIQLSTKF
jgi:hypothetical protein